MWFRSEGVLNVLRLGIRMGCGESAGSGMRLHSVRHCDRRGEDMSGSVGLLRGYSA